ncbi:CocE/NonD family hydrolase [Bradyrhizobium sp. LHD-71]|uniref:CocE/NonD family hydrolase n=1 Tax=Bradyrhizobium sp. LHD-71 TaxID=3072141 RepID=UPI002810481E|nr:CocE/NonD family hydrolase [Bradyrhizobium sp. LHD-71]MDQ8731506.1 CocE/NonD family hydrolase [Bradyrhizobium sp. LHD-71]
MSDSDDQGAAWRVPPSAYLARRPPAYGIPAPPRSLYLTMKDGCRLAVDIYLPTAPASAAAGPRCPTICIFTPYYRRFKVKAGATGVEPSPNVCKYRDTFVPRGYALVVVDVRGTGASFGTRDSFRSPREREDYREIADWIVAQPWSDGRIGATGVSYLGAACDFLASTGHPAVKAIAPLFAVWDTYSDHYYPGGILLNQLAETYDQLMVGLDHDRREILRQFAYYADPNLEGPHPVDEDPDGTSCRAAVAEHVGNFHMPDFITEFRFKEQPLPYDETFSSSSFSPYHYMSGIKPDVAIYSVSGWMDGAGYANGAISRHLTLPNPNRYLLLGPWDHGARVNVSPWRNRVDPEFVVLAEVLRFFDEHLAGMETGLRAEAPIHYFTMHDETWRAADAWPPIEAAETRFFLSTDGELSRAGGAAGSDVYKTDFGFGTGEHTRYERIAGIDNRDYYTDWQGRDAALLRYTSAPLDADVEMTGHAVAEFWLASSEADGAVHVYLSEIEAAGRERYVTEGVLRALHRKDAVDTPHHRTSWPTHSYTREDAAPLVPGRPERLRIALLPVSWSFRKGSRIRVAIAGADSDHYVQVPHGRPPILTLHHGGTMPSHVALPLRVKKQ